MMISTMIPEPHRSRLIEAGNGACKHHHPRTGQDSDGNPTFFATKEYRADREKLEAVIDEIKSQHTKLFTTRDEQLELARKFSAMRKGKA